METVITRFAPSPTGYLHIGGARTALFNWLYARNQGGKFVLRIEDTDQLRSTEESVRAILDAMHWLGLDWDEGPYYQTDRLDIYEEYLRKLLDSGHAYYCDCTPEQLEEHRKQALATGAKPKYSGRCRDRNLGPGRDRVIRFRSPQSGETVFNDLIKGPRAFDNTELDDLVIRKSDGMPTYNFAVVIDDVSMNINTVIRGDDHVNNTPRQILIYRALNVSLPQFAHVPMILGEDRSRLSKRHGATSVMAYKDMGFLPEALVNYLVRLGWSHGDQEVFTRDELVSKFSLEHVGRAAAVFDQTKLLWLNAHYIKERSADDLATLLSPFLTARGYPERPQDYIVKAVETLQPRCQTLEEMAQAIRFYMVDEVEYDQVAAKKFLRPNMVDPFRRLVEEFKQLEVFDEQHLENLFRGVTAELGIKLGKIAQPVRVALTGVTASPGLFEVIDILGRETVLKRMEKALVFVTERAAAAEK